MKKVKVRPVCGTGVKVMQDKLYRPQCDRISAPLSQVMRLTIAKPFESPVDLNLHPYYASIVEYPMDLFTIKTRLDMQSILPACLGR